MRIFFRFITKHFFQGILVLLPISLTVYISVNVFQAVDHLGRNVLGQWVPDPESNLLTGFGFIATVLFIVLVGYFSSLWIGGHLFRWIETIFIRSPLIKTIYGLIRDTVHSIFGEKKFLSRVVLLDLPNLGYKRLGFVTQEPITFVDGEEEKIVVYMPHSFQVSGEMILISKKSVKFLDIPPEIALKLIMSAGIVKK